MADLRPFRRLHYSGPLEEVLAPPYDVLSEEEAAQWRQRSPYNVARLTRPQAGHGQAAELLERWLADGVLVEDPEPALFVHETRFDTRQRLDLLGVLRLQPYEEKVVLPHERTHRGPKEDRLALLRATRTSLEPLWFLAEGLRPLLEGAPGGEQEEFEFTGQRHRLRRVTDPGWVAAVRSLLSGQQVLIADGHHRYETALAYAQELGGGPEASSRFTLALLTDISDPGLMVSPTHRLLKAGVAITGGEPVGSLEDMLAALRGRVAAGTYRAGSFQVLPLEGELAVVELHRQIIDNVLGRRSPEENLAYTRDPAEAVRWVDEGRGVAAFFLDVPDLGAVLQLAREGKTLPQKATYFHPKPPSGMAFHRLDPGRDL